jgi:hypothetical protein
VTRGPSAQFPWASVVVVVGASVDVVVSAIVVVVVGTVVVGRTAAVELAD